MLKNKEKNFKGSCTIQKIVIIKYVGRQSDILLSQVASTPASRRESGKGQEKGSTFFTITMKVFNILCFEILMLFFNLRTKLKKGIVAFAILRKIVSKLPVKCAY